MITITVIGTPAPQGSKKFVGVKNGRGILVESSKAVKPWRQAVVWAARESGVKIPGPVIGQIIFTVRKPKSAPHRTASATGRTAGLAVVGDAERKVGGKSLWRLEGSCSSGQRTSSH